MTPEHDACFLGLDFDKFLTCFALAHYTLNYILIFAEISKNGLGLIPLKVPQAASSPSITTICIIALSLPFPELSR